jgi:hypothetical protein
MAKPGTTLPPDEWIIERERRGDTWPQMAREILDEGADKAAVERLAGIIRSYARDYGLISRPRRQRHKRHVPWRVRREHVDDYWIRLLRWQAKVANGETLSQQIEQKRQRRIDKFHQICAEKGPVSIWYTPLKGFRFTERNTETDRELEDGIWIALPPE